MPWKSGPLDQPTLVTTGYTGNLPATNELPVDMHPRLMDSYVSLTPLTVMLTKIGEDTAKNFRVDWMEKKEIPTTVTVATSESSAGTTVVFVANATTLRAGTLLYNPRTNDLRSVDSTPTTQSVTVTISKGGTTSAAWLSGDVVFVLLPATAENDTTNAGVSVANQNAYNYEQLCKLQFALSYLENDMTTFFGGPGSKREELKGQKYREYRIKKEHLLMFGGRSTATSSGVRTSLMGGLTYFLRDGTVFKDFGGIMTESGYRNWIGDYKDQNPDATEVYHYCAGNVADVISLFGADKLQISPATTEYGIDIVTYKSRGIKSNIVVCPLLDATPTTRGWGFLLDLERIRMKTLTRDTFFPWDRTRGAGGEIMYDTYLGVYSLMVANESRHAMHIGALV